MNQYNQNDNLPVLLEKISIYVNEFRTCIVGHGKPRNAVNEAYAKGESEGIPKEVIASMIRNGILSAGFSDRTVRRYLPQDLNALVDMVMVVSANANLAIQTKAKPTKQLAPDSISKVIEYNPAATTVEQPEPEPEPSYEERVGAQKQNSE